MFTDPPADNRQSGVSGRVNGTPSGAAPFRRVFRAEPAAVRDALRRAVARFARRLTPDEAGTLELTLAEVLNNVVEHGYADLPPGLIELRLRLDRAGLACRVEDFGHPMPGLAAPDPDLPAITKDVDDLAEGGWGWALIRELTTDLDYARRDGRNVLTFRVPASVQTQPA